MRLLLTGGCGFIGSHALRHIIRQPNVERVINLDCLTYAGSLDNVRDIQSDPRYLFERIDLRDRDAVAQVVTRHRITHVMHLAAESHVDRSIAAPADFMHTNVLGTFHLLEACRTAWDLSTSDAAGQYRFHHVSTDEVYGALGPTGNFTEQSPYAPNSPYSASKAASDMLVRAYHMTYGLPMVITHSCNNFGPGQYAEKLIPVVIARALSRQPIPVYGRGQQVREWLYVVDHAEALWRVFQDGRNGQNYNIGSGYESSNINVVERICDEIDTLHPTPGARTRDLIRFVEDRPGHDFRYALDTTRLRQELGWTPRYEFNQALRETIRLKMGSDPFR